MRAFAVNWLLVTVFIATILLDKIGRLQHSMPHQKAVFFQNGWGNLLMAGVLVIQRISRRMVIKLGFTLPLISESRVILGKF